jgi:hypothetical protein
MLRNVLKRNVLSDTFCSMSRDVLKQNVLSATSCRTSRDVPNRAFWQNQYRTKIRTFWIRSAFGGCVLLAHNISLGHFIKKAYVMHPKVIVSVEIIGTFSWY